MIKGQGFSRGLAALGEVRAKVRTKIMPVSLHTRILGV